MRGRVTCALLLCASTAWGTVTATAPRGLNCVRDVNDAAICARDVSAGPPGAEGSTPVDWTGSFDAVWRLEPDASALPSSANEGTCGTDCALTGSAGSFGEPWADAREGFGAFVVPNQARRTCADATCDELDGNGAAAVSFGCMARLANASAARTLVNNFATGSNGYLAQVDTNRKLVCTIGASPDVALTSTTALTLDRWTAVACSYAAIGAPIVDGTVENAGAQGAPAADAAVFSLSVTGANSWVGALDLCWLRRNSISTAQACRIAMCGITGVEFGCTCGAGTGLASYAQRGRYDAAGMTCTPSDCTAAAP